MQCEGFSRSRIQGLIRAERMRVNGTVVVRSACKVEPGAVVTLAIPPPVPAEPQPEDIPLSVVFEDEHIIVIDKPAGLVVHPAPGHLSGTLVNALLHHCPALEGIGGVARPGIVHRLDQDTSGLMVVAKTEAAMRTLAKEFSSHANIRKTYLALVHGTPVPAEGRVENLIGRCPWDRKKMAVVEKNGKTAVTNYRTLSAGRISLVECVIETGRTHQIRVHMASLGYPIVGDALYGRPGWDRQLDPVPPRQMLHAWKLELKHPVTRVPLAFEAPLPPEFSAIKLALPT
jgi:23S rRNA pseudouridine1911/1915/1917 synthase